MKKILFSFLLLLGAFLTGCNIEKPKDTSNVEEKIKVYTTVFPLEDFTKKIGGEFVEVNTVYPPGSDEHTFEPSQKDVIKMAESNLFLYIGHNLEGFVEQSKDILEKEQVKTVAVGEAIEIEEVHHEENDTEESHEHHDDENATEENHESHDGENATEENHESHDGESGTENHDEHNHGDVDPHLWLDPIYSIGMAETIKNELVNLMPKQKDYFEKNYASLKNELEDLNHQFEETVQTGKTNKIIVSHAAYGYWEDRYGLEQISISGLSSTSEPSQKELKEIIETAKNNKIDYVLFEQNINSKLADIVQKEIGAEPLTLKESVEITEIPAANEKQCGQAKLHDLEGAKKLMNYWLKHSKEELHQVFA